MGQISRVLQLVDFSANRAVTRVASVICFLVMVLVTADVTGRYFFNHPIPGTLEISEATLPFVIFLPLAYYAIVREHIRITMLISRLPPKVAAWCTIFMLVIVTTFFFFMMRQAFLYTLMSWGLKETSFGAIAIPLWIPKLSIFVGCLLFSLHSLGSLGLTVINQIWHKEAS